MKRTIALRPITLAASLLLTGQAFAVGNGTINSGTGSVTQDGNTTTVNQTSDRMIVDWNNMDVRQNETLNFNQKNSDASVLNRIHSVDPTQINGTLNANGNVFIVNPNGVLIGNGANVNVGSLIASSLDISDDDFKAGKLNFKGEGKGPVVNEGTINAKGSVGLIGGAEVTNNGTIKSANGNVVLASGNDITLSFYGSGLQVKLNKGSLNALVKNGGLIVASNGSVKLTAWAIDALTRSVINNTGTIEATTAYTAPDGTITLESLGNGTVDVGGTLKARAKGFNLASINVKGDSINVADGATLDAEGDYRSVVNLNARAKNGAVTFGNSTVRGDNIYITADNVLTGGEGHRPTFQKAKWSTQNIFVDAASEDQNLDVGDAKRNIKDGTGLVDEGFIKSATEAKSKLTVSTRKGNINVNNGNLDYGDLSLRSGSGNILLNAKVKANTLDATAGGNIEQAEGADVNATETVTLRAGKKLLQRANIQGKRVTLEGDSIVSQKGAQTTADDEVLYRGNEVELNGNVTTKQLTVDANKATQGSDSTIKAEALTQQRGDLDLSAGKNDIGSLYLSGRSANIKTTGDTTVDYANLSGNLSVFSQKNLTAKRVDVGGDATLSASEDVRVDDTVNAQGNIDIKGKNVKGNDNLPYTGAGTLSAGKNVTVTAENGVDLKRVNAGTDVTVTAKQGSVNVDGLRAGQDAKVEAGKKVTLSNLNAQRDATVSAGQEGIDLNYGIASGRNMTLKTTGNITKSTAGEWRVGGDLTYDVAQTSKVSYADGSTAKPTVGGKTIDSRGNAGADDGANKGGDGAGDNLTPEQKRAAANNAFDKALADADKAYEAAMQAAQKKFQQALNRGWWNIFGAMGEYFNAVNKAQRDRSNAVNQATQQRNNALKQITG